MCMAHGVFFNQYCVAALLQLEVTNKNGVVIQRDDSIGEPQSVNHIIYKMAKIFDKLLLLIIAITKLLLTLLMLKIVTLKLLTKLRTYVYTYCKGITA